MVVNRQKANEHYNSFEICKECDKYRRIFTHVQKNETKLFLNNLNYLFGNESMNTKTLRLADSAEPQEVFTNVLSTKEKREEKRKGNMT